MYKRILVAVDGNPVSRSLDEAIMLAKAGNATLLLLNVSVIDPVLLWNEENWMVPGFTPGEGELIHSAEVLTKVQEKVQQAGVTSEIKQVEDAGQNLGVIIAEQAEVWEADLIVAGTHGRKGVDRLLMGSVAENIVRNATVPVLLIRGNQD
ncbi:Putative universal stress protein [Ferriphaselus amnicola]|uniref:Universal stress protein n=1 Tax=Ferriphaselus amnicola TaxID=1188319 RepID=A0A2Z6GF06_9PROT|nr:universal stress protein [Ferriphaselus amnicola]BBE51824.1 Putative universal stress protein [Ferriphaselus amnicola]